MFIFFFFACSLPGGELIVARVRRSLRVSYTGNIIGIVHRQNDVEDKLVMAPEGVIFTQNEIAEQVHFQEQYYKTEVEALYQKSCGIEKLEQMM